MHEDMKELDIIDNRTPFQRWVNGDGPRARPTYVYIASSWRNPLQQGIVHLLRAARIDCYDFRKPTSNDPARQQGDGFRWSEIDPSWLGWKPEDWRKALAHPIAQAGFAQDRDALLRADCCVLVLPCGRSAHLEVGYAAACGKPVFTLAIEQVEPELMNLLLGPPEHICTDTMELLGRLGVED